MRTDGDLIRRLLAALCLALLTITPGAPDARAQDSTPPEADAPTAATPQTTPSPEQRELDATLALNRLEGLESARVDLDGSVAVVTGIADDPSVVRKAESIVKSITGAAEVENDIELSHDASDRIRGAATRLRTRLDAWIAMLPLVPIAIGVFIAACVIAWLVGRWRWAFARMTRNPFLRDIARKLAQVAIVIIGVLAALEILDATALVGGVLGAAGVAGIAIGFAFRDLIENYIAGVLLSFRQPFRPKDYVVIAEYSGLVTSMNSRSTVLTTFDGNIVRIPNAIVFKTPLVNYFADPRRRFSFTVGVGYDVDLSEAIEVGVEVIRTTPGVLAEPEPFGIVTKLGDSNITVELYGWVDQSINDFGKVRSVAMMRVKNEYDARDIDMPEPIYSLRMLDPLGPARDAAAIKPREPRRAPDEAVDVARDRTAEEFADKATREDGEPDLLAPAGEPGPRE